MMKKIGLVTLSLLFLSNLVFGKVYSEVDNSSPIKAKVLWANKTEAINDGICSVEILSKDSTFIKWPNKSLFPTSLVDSSVCEGQTYTIELYNLKGDTVLVSKEIPALSMPEKLNSTMVPIVGWLASKLFWDPFAAIGVYDPIIYDENGNVVYHNNGTPKTQGIPFIVVWLVLGALYFTFSMKFINVRGVKYAVNLLRGKYEEKDGGGEVSHFQALTTALSATVGLGNIAGVAVAVGLGGAGATFWMIVAGLLGMASKFVECTLGVKYREVKDGVVSGGPMYYLSKGIKGPFGKVLAYLFAVLCIGGSFGGGNMFQANQAFSQVKTAFPGMEEYGFVFGLVMAILVAFVIIGGIKSIAKVTDKIVPFMCGVYVLAALVIIGMNLENTAGALKSIINGAFSPDALKGGFIGVLIIGFKRAAFSNEAGVGSASIAHSAVKTNHPASEGLVALLEPFIDTVVVCTMTALVLIFTGFAADPQGMEGAELTSAAFSSEFPWFSWVLLGAIVLFAFSTMISWSYYGQKAWEFIFGRGKVVEYSYKLVFLFFVVVGASSSLGAVLDFSDLMILGMALPNVLGLIILLPKVKEELKNFMDYIKSKA